MARALCLASLLHRCFLFYLPSSERLRPVLLRSLQGNRLNASLFFETNVGSFELFFVGRPADSGALRALSFSRAAACISPLLLLPVLLLIPVCLLAMNRAHSASTTVLICF